MSRTNVSKFNRFVGRFHRAVSGSKQAVENSDIFHRKHDPGLTRQVADRQANIRRRQKAIFDLNRLAGKISRLGYRDGDCLSWVTRVCPIVGGGIACQQRPRNCA